VEIIVVSDGSTDGTNNILAEFSHIARLQIVLAQETLGKAARLNYAIALSTGEIVAFVDARQMVEANAVRLLMENFSDPEVGCASGELLLGDPGSGEAVRGMGLYWKIEKVIRELESSTGSVIGATGALYAVRRDLLVRVPSETILDDVFIPMNVVRQRSRVVFDSRARAWDVPDLGTKREFARKVRTLTGNYQLLQLSPWLLRAENPVRFSFISHKLLRLLVPFALCATLITSLLLHSPIYRMASALQIIFYGLSVLALIRLRQGLLARVSDAALTFVLLNTAAAVAFANFVTRRKAAWT
jgi:biofilm PGA synthesis N-glycosyltransferase PgaC